MANNDTTLPIANELKLMTAAEIREMLRISAIAIGCDPAYVALPALATAAGLIGNKRSILLKPGWTEPCIIWTLVVAESGTMKSPGFLAAVNPVHRLQLQMEFTHKKETAAWEAGGSNGDARTLRRVIIDDSTIEALRPILEENPGGLLLAKDELGGGSGPSPGTRADRRHPTCRTGFPSIAQRRLSRTAGLATNATCSCREPPSASPAASSLPSWQKP